MKRDGSGEEESNDKSDVLEQQVKRDDGNCLQFALSSSDLFACQFPSPNEVTWRRYADTAFRSHGPRQARWA